MTRKMVAEVDILSTLPEDARIKLASRMTTLYRVEPGQVLIEKGAVGKEMCAFSMLNVPVLLELTGPELPV